MAQRLTFFAKEHYLEFAPGDVDRSMTIAAFYVAQGASALDYSRRQPPTSDAMRRDILTFLLSESAVGYWLREKKRLEVQPGAPEWLSLSRAGLQEISFSYQNEKNAACEDRVRWWIDSMINGGGVTEIDKTFAPPLKLPASDQLPRTRTQATQMMAAHFKARGAVSPRWVRDKREEIIARLMAGGPVAAALVDFQPPQ